MKTTTEWNIDFITCMSMTLARLHSLRLTFSSWYPNMKRCEQMSEQGCNVIFKFGLQLIIVNRPALVRNAKKSRNHTTDTFHAKRHPNLTLQHTWKWERGSHQTTRNKLIVPVQKQRERTVFVLNLLWPSHLRLCQVVERYINYFKIKRVRNNQLFSSSATLVLAMKVNLSGIRQWS